MNKGTELGEQEWLRREGPEYKATPTGERSAEVTENVLHNSCVMPDKTVYFSSQYCVTFLSVYSSVVCGWSYRRLIPVTNTCSCSPLCPFQSLGTTTRVYVCVV